MKFTTQIKLIATVLATLSTLTTHARSVAEKLPADARKDIPQNVKPTSYCPRTNNVIIIDKS